MLETPTLRLLLEAMSQPWTFYVLGAGASAGLVPMASQLGSFVEREHYKIGIYPALSTEYSPFRDRVIGDVPVDPRDLQTFLLSHIAPGTLDLVVQRGLLHSVGGDAPPQFVVFGMVGRPSTIFSFNLDGLARSHCRDNHWVLEPHGAIDRLWVEGPSYREWLYATAASDLVLPHLTPKWLAGPEPSSITNRVEYRLGRLLFERCQALVIIGYSFGRRKGSFDDRNLSIRQVMRGPRASRWQDTFDDAESFEYFIDLLRSYPRPVFVVSPSPGELVDLLQQRVRSREVYSVPVRWEVLAAEICRIASQTPAFWRLEELEILKRACNRG